MNDVSNFAASLVEMARAMEELPRIREELRAARYDLSEARAHIQRLELRAIDRKAEIDELSAKVRQVEAERDDAELRFLSHDDALQAVRRALGTVIAEAQDTLQVLEPSKSSVPEPVITGTPNVDSQSLVGQSAAAPSANTSDTPIDAGPGHVTPMDAGSIGGAGSEGETPPTDGGESAADPTATQVPTEPVSVSYSTATSTDNATSHGDGVSVQPNPSAASPSGDPSRDAGEAVYPYVGSPTPQPHSSTEDGEWDRLFGRQSHAS
jgi:hypothetical protein